MHFSATETKTEYVRGIYESVQMADEMKAVWKKPKLVSQMFTL